MKEKDSTEIRKYRGLGELSEIKEITFQDILVDMLEGDQNLDLKTQIYSPKDFAGLKVYEITLEEEEYKGCSKVINVFTEFYKRYMVSNERMGRTEILKTVSSLMDKEQIRMTLSDKLTTNMSK